MAEPLQGVHVYFRVYKNSLNIPKSIYKERPDLIKTANNRFVVDPGIPDSRKWVADRVKEILDNYDVDGIHFDDYFYYEKYEGELNDDETYRKYNNGRFSNKGDWRRNNTYLLVKEISELVRQSKPHVKFGVSPGVCGEIKKTVLLTVQIQIPATQTTSDALQILKSG